MYRVMNGIAGEQRMLTAAHDMDANMTGRMTRRCLQPDTLAKFDVNPEIR